MIGPCKEAARRACGWAAAALLRLRSRPFSLPAGPAVVIAPHADDETLGCGGLIAAMAGAGTRLDVVFITDSAASHRGHPSLDPSQVARRRAAEAEAALAVLGLPPGRLHFLGAADGELERLPPGEAGRLRGDLEALLRSLAPEELFLPWRQDGSTEHAAAFDLALAAAAGLPARIWEYPVWAWWDPLRRFAPRLGSPGSNWRWALGPGRSRKRRALACHRTQLEALPPWPRPVLPAAIARGCCGPWEFYFGPRPAGQRPGAR
jgi:LmbE family N-acetylglucosaminyl deacetylase